MDEFALRTFNLCKRFGRKLVVNNLNLSIKRGDIYGFIGPNGAGKTTVMKVILDLLRPSSGEIELFGQPKNSVSLRHVGSLIEAPGLYNDCTAYENMKRFSILCGGTDRDIQYYLNMVGLGNIGKLKVKAYSLGMKQRLGIAIALIGNPEMLILDEPVNGLDPMGMKDIRDIIQYINKERGVTFFISSHLLGELEKIANVYGIISNGYLAEEITAAELEKRCVGSIFVCCNNPQNAAEILKQRFGIENVTVIENRLNVYADPDLVSRINEELVMAGVAVTELGVNKANYEDYFLQKMGQLNMYAGGVPQYAQFASV